MGYKALYRTYRPLQFADVVGQEVIVRTLQSALANRKISHAYLFSGPRGTGKTSIARILAKALNCAEFPTIEPCGVCQSCREIADSNSPDVIEIDAASNNGVDEIRDIRDKVKFLPVGAHHKIYIIDEVHMLSSGAFNALLKTLEEPPRHVIFILATTEPHKVLPTILSRCQRYDFKSLTVKELYSRLEKVSKQENMDISEEALVSIAESAEGGVRDALSYLDQAASFADGKITVDDVNNVTGNLSYNKLIELVGYFESKQIEHALKTVNELINLGKEVSKVVGGLLQFYRDVLLFKNVDIASYPKYIFEKEGFHVLAEKLTVEKIFYYVDILSDVQAKLRFSNTPHIFLEVALIKMMNTSQEDLDFVKRIKQIEETIEDLPKGSDFSHSGPKTMEFQQLEHTVQRIVTELSKLEIPKWIEKVEALELHTKKAQLTNVDNSTNNIEQKVDELVQSQKKIEKWMNEIVNNDELEMKLQHLEMRVDEMNQASQILTQPQSENHHKDEKIEEGWVKGLMDEALRSIRQEIQLLKTVEQPEKRSTVEIEEIQDKLEYLENQMFRMLSEKFSQQSTSPMKKTKHTSPIAVVGGEIIEVDVDKDVEKKKPMEQQHLDLSLEPKNVEPQEKQPTLGGKTEKLPEDLPSEEETLETKIEVEEEIEANEETENLDDEVDEIFRLKEKTEVKQEKIEVKREEPIMPVVNKALDEDVTKVFELNGEKIIDKRNSQLVTKTKKIIEDLEPTKGLFSFEKEEKQSIETPKESKPTTNIEEEVAFYSYSERIIERILHDSRSVEAKNDKSRIVQIWEELSNFVQVDKISYAEMLKKGKVVAVGDKEFILVYPTSGFCNEVMRPAFKREARKILYDQLGDAYNYMALTESVWLEKRTEYVNQYNIGIQKPKLTPIKDPTLHVVIKDEGESELSEKERMIQSAYDLFGKDIVKIE